MKKTENNSKRLQDGGSKKNKKFWMLSSGIVAGIVAISVGAGVACIPQKTHVDPKKGLDVGVNETFDHDVKQNFLASIMQDVETGIDMQNINVALKTEVKGQKINVEVRKGKVAVKKGKNESLFINTSLPILIGSTDTISIHATLNDGELYFSLNDFDKEGKKTNVKYKIHVGKDESTRTFYTDEHGNKNSKYAPTELENYITAVKQCFGMAMKEKGKKQSPLNLSIDFDKILNALWGIDVKRSNTGVGYSAFAEIPVQMVGETTPILTVPFRADFSNQYHLRGITAPATSKDEIADYINIEALPQPMGETGIKASVSVMNKDIKPEAPKNPDQYIPLVDSLKFIKEINKLTKSTNFGFDLDVALTHEVDSTSTEEALLKVNGDAKLKKSIMSSGGKFDMPEFVNAGILMRVNDKDNEGVKHYYDQKLQASYKNDNVYVEYNDSTKVRLAKSLLDKIIPVQVKEISNTNTKVAGNMSSIEKALRSMQDKAVIAGIVRAIDDVKKVGTSEVIEAVKDGYYGELKDIVDNITLDDKKISVVIDLTKLNLLGKITITVDPVNLLTVNFDNVKGLGFGLNGKLSVSDKEDIKVRNFNNDDYYEISHVHGMIDQFTQLSKDKKLSANVKASIFKADNTLENIKDSGGFVGDINTSLDGNTKEGTVSADISWYQLDKFTKNGDTEQTVLPRRHDFEIKADITDHNDTYNKETKSFDREEFGTKAFMSINDYEYDLVNNKALNEKSKPYKVRLSATTINDFISFGKKVAAINDIRISTILDMIKKNHAESVITSIINNHLNNMIKYPVVSGTSFEQTTTHDNDTYTVSLNRDVMGLDKDLDVKATFGKDSLKGLSVKTATTIEKLGGEQQINLDITLDDYKPVEENWNFSKEVEIEVGNPNYVEPTPEAPETDEEVEKKLELLRANDVVVSEEGEKEPEVPTEPEINTTDKYLKETVVKGNHQLEKFVDIDSLSIFLDYGLNTAMFGIGTRYEVNSLGELVAIENKTGANTYHVKFAVDSISMIGLSDIIIDFNLHFSKDGIKVLGTFDMPIVRGDYVISQGTLLNPMIYNNPWVKDTSFFNQTPKSQRGDCLGKYIRTKFGFDSSAVDETGALIDGGALYFTRNCEYDDNPFKDARRVKFNDFKSDIKGWATQYLVNSYKDWVSDPATEQFSMKFVSNFLGNYTLEELENGNQQFIFNVEGLSAIQSQLKTAVISVDATSNGILYNSDISIGVAIINANMHISLLNITENGGYIESWTEEVENSLTSLKDLTSGLAWSVTPYVENTSIHDPIKNPDRKIYDRDGLVQTLDGKVISYDEYLKSRETPAQPSDKVED